MSREANERPLSEMSQEEIIAEIEMIRTRRAQARERRVVEKSEDGVKKKKGPVEVGGGALEGLLDDLFDEGVDDASKS